jgi:hypothetical protein
MAFKVRRVVTGHNASGKNVVKSDELVTGAARFRRHHGLRDLVDRSNAGRQLGRR